MNYHAWPRYLLVLVALWICGTVQAVTITDSRGEQRFPQPPERVVALNWGIAENLIELGITPVGVADTAGYRKWVVTPALPEPVIDVGTRNEPSFERIAALQPDVIILSNNQSGLVERMARIAPVVFFDAFKRDHDNAAAAREIFLQLARLFDREAVAKQKLDARDERIQELRQALVEHFGSELPRVSSVRFMSPSLMLVYGDNSLPQHALRQLGLEPALPQPPSQWGFVQKKVTELGAVEDGIILHFEPFDDADRLFNSPLWKALPAVRAGRVAAIEPTWTYGGAMSIGHLADAMTRSLLRIEPQ